MNQLHSVATVLLSLILGTNAFSYKDAKNWGKEYSDCNGKNQSPILLKQTSLTKFTEYKERLRFTDSNKLPKKLTIKNTGHTVEMKADWSGEPPSCAGGPLNGSYVLEKTTFHWAPKAWAAEVLDYPWMKQKIWVDMEMHMFFYRTDLKSFEKAQTQKGGLAVFNIWFWGLWDKHELSFNNLERNLHKVHSPNSTTEIPPFRFTSILDDRVGAFYVYEGSLDYPPCSESVTWFLSDNPNGTPQRLLNEIKKIKLAEEDVSNVRPFQALNKRQVKIVYNLEMDYKGDSH